MTTRCRLGLGGALLLGGAAGACSGPPTKAGPAVSRESGDSGPSGGLGACAQALAELQGERRAPDREISACGSPTGRTYVDVAAEWGLLDGAAASLEHNRGGVAAVADFDGDGHLDVVLGYAGQPLVHHVGTGAGFRAAVLEGTEGAGPLAVADLDGDGALDVVSVGPPATWLRNDGGQLVAQALQTGLGAPIVDLSPGDLDGDGHVDLFATATGAHDGGPEDRADRWLRGDGTGRFTPVALPDPQSGGVGFDSMVADLDADGDLDVYTVNDFGTETGPNALWHNDSGDLVPATDGCGCDLAISGMGLDVGDLDGDAVPELLVASTGRNHLLQRGPDGAYVDRAAAVGADPLSGLPTMSWGQVFFDHDDDGDLDIVVAEGDLWLAHTDPELRAAYDAPLHLMVQSGPRDDPAFEDRAAELGLTGTGSWRSVVPADFDGDGQVDLLVTDVAAPPRLFLARGCTGHGAIELDVPLHARVEACIGGERQVRWAHTESGWGAAGPAVVRFGLGTADPPAEVVVVSAPGAAR